MTSDVFNIVLGSVISLIASCIVTTLQNIHSRTMAKQSDAHENQKWAREKKVDVYVQLAGFLDGISICLDAETGMVDAQSFVEYRRDLADYIEKYRGEITLFVPSAINVELMKLRSELYKLSTEKEAQKIDLNDIMNSKAMEVVKHAKSIFVMMQRDLDVEVEKTSKHK